MNIYNFINYEKIEKNVLLHDFNRNGFESEHLFVIDSEKENLNFKDEDISDKLIDKMAKVSEDIKYLIIFIDDILENYINLNKFYDYLLEKSLSIILITNNFLDKHHKSFSSDCFSTSSSESLFRLHNIIKESTFTSSEKKYLTLTPRMGTLERYSSNNKEVIKFYKSLLNKEVLVITHIHVAVPNQYQLGIFSCEEPIEKRLDVVKKSTYCQALYCKDEITFIISDHESFTIKIPKQLYLLKQFLVTDDYSYIRFLSFLYGKHGKDFLFNYRNNMNLSDYTKKRLEKGLNEYKISRFLEEAAKEEMSTFLTQQPIDLYKYIKTSDDIREESSYKLCMNSLCVILNNYLLLTKEELSFRKGFYFSFLILLENEINMPSRQITQDSVNILISKLPNSLDFSSLFSKEDSIELENFKRGMTRGFQNSLTIEETGLLDRYLNLTID